MRLNNCSLNAITLNGVRCGRNVSALVLELHPPVPPVAAPGGGSTRVLRDTFTFNPPREIEQDDRVPLTFEQPVITVSATIRGATGTVSQDVSAVQADFVSITGFAVSQAEAPVSVSISSLRIK